MVSSFESALSRLVMKGKKSQIQGLPRWLGAAVAISLAVLTGLMYLSMDRPSTKNEPAKIQPTNGKEADPLQEAKLIFALSCDPDSCKRALQILGRLPKTSTYPLVSQEIEGLTPQDDDYLNSATFPPADAWYWAEQLLLKKIIDGNEMAESPGRQTALAQAEILWFWTMRMVRLSELSFEFKFPFPSDPPGNRNSGGKGTYFFGAIKPSKANCKKYVCGCFGSYSKGDG